MDMETSADMPVAEFSVGDVVRVVGFDEAQLNQHVGKIVTPQDDNGRLAVSLHGSIWPEASDKEDQYPDLVLRPANLRHIVRETHPKALSVRGTVSPETVVILLGGRGWGLPDNVLKHISEQLRIERLHKDDVSVSGCSSCWDIEMAPKGVVPDEDRSEWWISEAGSMPNGYGSEYLEFTFGPVPRRVEFVSIRIPPLPMGPWSVREFHLLALDFSGSWVVVSPRLETLDRGDLQEFALVPPVETTSVRVVCTSNAAAGAVGPLGFADCIGHFEVLFA
jgi:hypothetical protein